MADALTTPELLSERVVMDICPAMTRLCRKIAQQVDADLVYGETTCIEVFAAVSEAADEVVRAMLRRARRAMIDEQGIDPDELPGFLRHDHAGALSDAGP